MGDEETGFVALNSDMYFTCSSGLSPAKMCPTQSVVKTHENHFYLVKDDTATQQMGDFFCRWTVVIAAAIAAAGIVTGGAALAVLAVVAVAASMALCGGLMAPLRKWTNYSTLNAYGREDAYTLTSQCSMVCPIGGVTTYAPGITNQWQALAYTARNTVWAVVEGAIVGKLGSSGFSAFAGTATPTMATALGNFLVLNASARGVGVIDQVLFEGMLRNGKSLSETGDEAIAGATMFEQPFINIWDKASGKNPQPLSWQDFYYAGLSLAGMKMMADTASTHESIPKEAVTAVQERISELAKTGKKFLFERGKIDIIAQRRETAYNFYKEHYPDMTDRQIKSHISGIDFSKPVEVVNIPKGTELYQYTKVDSEGTVLRGEYYTTDPNATPSELGVSGEYSVRGPDGQYTGEVKPVTQEKVTLSQDTEGLKSTSAPVEDTWSLEGGTPVPTEGGATQIYIPKQ